VRVCGVNGQAGAHALLPVTVRAFHLADNGDWARPANPQLLLAEHAANTESQINLTCLLKGTDGILR